VGVASADMMKRTREIVEVRAVEDLGASADDTRDYNGLSTRLADILRKQAAAKRAMNTQLPEVDLMLLQEDFVKAVSKVQPSSKREGFTTIPDTTWAQVGALHKVRKELSLAITRPIDTPELFARFGFQSPSGVLLWGPPGCGKTLLAKAVANEAKANFISVKGPELLNKYV
ncbi:AAA family ATPase, partial [Erythrobacter sp. YJ-T3-07]|nr:AAA family ATPase [Erythrobacter sp. YJ-T3-07]